MGQREVVRRLGLRLAGRLIAGSPAALPRPRRIAVFRPDHLGDVILSEPALRRLRQGLPNTAIDLWVGPWAAEVAAGIEGVNVQALPFPAFERAPKVSPIAPYTLLLNEAKRLYQQRYDALIVLRFDHWWGGLLGALARIPVRVGYDQPDLAPFLTHRLPYRPGRHESIQSARLVGATIRLFGQPAPATPLCSPRLCFPAGTLPGGLPERYVVFHPGAGAPVKRWRLGGFAALARHIRARYGLGVVISGSTGERDLVAATGATMDFPVFPAVGLPLPDLAGVLRRAAVVVGPDSGILHLAGAVGAPTVRLFGPVDWRTFGPFRDANAVVVESPFLCAPCNRLDYPADELEWHTCIRQISVEPVIAAVDGVLARAGW